MFWANNSKNDKIAIKYVKAVLENNRDPHYYDIVLVTPHGKIVWTYTSKNDRDSDLQILKTLRDKYQSNPW